jgi:hypothetical protein
VTSEEEKALAEAVCGWRHGAWPLCYHEADDHKVANTILAALAASGYTIIETASAPPSHPRSRAVNELDEFLRWVAGRRDRDRIEGLGYGTLGAAIDMFRAERLTGRKYQRWVDAYDVLHSKVPSRE